MTITANLFLSAHTSFPAHFVKILFGWVAGCIFFFLLFLIESSSLCRPRNCHHNIWQPYYYGLRFAFANTLTEIGVEIIQKSSFWIIEIKRKWFSENPQKAIREKCEDMNIIIIVFSSLSSSTHPCVPPSAQHVCLSSTINILPSRWPVWCRLYDRYH